MDATDAILRADRLNTYYGRSQILFDVSFAVPPRGCVAILGRNGAGKTTLLKSVVGELRPASGEVEYKGRPISTLPTEKRARLGFGYVPQEGEVFGRLTVRDNLLLGALRLPKAEKNANLEQALALFPRLRERQDQYAATLSGGERKMLAIARVLIARPEILFLDEPTEGVWPTLVDEIGATLETMSRERAVVIVEQNIDMALRISTEAYVMERGELVLHEKSARLQDDPRLERYLAP